MRHARRYSHQPTRPRRPIAPDAVVSCYKCKKPSTPGMKSCRHCREADKRTLGRRVGVQEAPVVVVELAAPIEAVYHGQAFLVTWPRSVAVDGVQGGPLLPARSTVNVLAQEQGS